MALIPVATSISQNITLEAGGFIHNLNVDIPSQSNFSVDVEDLLNLEIAIDSQASFTPKLRNVKIYLVVEIDETFSLVSSSNRTVNTNIVINGQSSFSPEAKQSQHFQCAISATSTKTSTITVKRFVATSILGQSANTFLPFLKIGPSVQIDSQSGVTPLAQGTKYSFVSSSALSDTTFNLNARWFSVEFDCNSFGAPVYLMFTKPFDVVVRTTIGAQSNIAESINITRYIESVIASQSSATQEIFIKRFAELLTESSSVFDAELTELIEQLELQISAS